MQVVGKRVALVGGAGFIGHHLALELARRGARIAVVDSLEVNNLLTFATAPAGMRHRHEYLRMLGVRLELLRKAGVEIHLQDARDGRGLSAVLSALEPQIVLHLAAIAHAARSNADPQASFSHTLQTLLNTLDWARGRVEHFVYLSSSMVYGTFTTPEVAEDHPLEPIGMYGAMKLAAEKIVIAHGQVFQMPYTIVRPSALYGPRCVSRRVIQAFIEAALDGDPLVVDADASECIDFTYIDDLVAGLMLVIGNPVAAAGETFNLTCGHARQIGELVDLIRARFPGVRVKYVERDRLRSRRGTLSIQKARRLLGYEPRFELEAGLARYVDWYGTQLRPSAEPGVAAMAAAPMV